jgi:septum formation protein
MDAERQFSSLSQNGYQNVNIDVPEVFHMSIPIILASGSPIRSQMLERARVPFEVVIPRIDEDAVKAALLAEGAPPRDIADALAEAKARKISDKMPGRLVIGCDQVLDAGGTLLSKPATPDDALAQLKGLRGQRHMLLSAAVIYLDGEPIWRHVGQVRLTMRTLSDGWLSAYVARNWPGIGEAVGAYKLEEEGVRLFTRIDGDHFNVLGMPLLEILDYLTLRGVLQE